MHDGEAHPVIPEIERVEHLWSMISPRLLMGKCGLRRATGSAAVAGELQRGAVTRLKPARVER